MSPGIEVDIGTKATAGNFFGYTCIGNLVSNIVAMVFIISGVVFFIYLVWGGFDYLTSEGDKGKVGEAQKRISSALIGLAIVAASWAIYQIVLTFFGIDLSKLCTDNPVG
jgi:TRAP-type C4-dicarboxylate transport system permease small subunit